MDDVGVQVARRIDVAHQNRKRFGRRRLLCAHVGRTEAIARWRAAGQIDRVRHLEVVAEALLDDQLGALERRRHHVCGCGKKGGNFNCKIYNIILYLIVTFIIQVSFKFNHITLHITFRKCVQISCCLNTILPFYL